MVARDHVNGEGPASVSAVGGMSEAKVPVVDICLEGVKKKAADKSVAFNISFNLLFEQHL